MIVLAYVLGLLTVPALAGLVSLCWLVEAWLERRGFTFEAKTGRNTDSISNYTLRHDIWWERAFGPVFVGGWYFEQSGRRRVNRWIGLGQADGVCVMAFRKRDLGEVEVADARA